MQSAAEKPKKAPRKHVTTACVPCRESKIRCDGATPNCHNCQKKGKECKYQHGDDKRKVSLRAATELFAARIDQLCQFIYDHGLEPPLMDPGEEAALNRVLDTLRIPWSLAKKRDPGMKDGQTVQLQGHVLPSPGRSLRASPLGGQLTQERERASAASSPQSMLVNPSSNDYNCIHWDFGLPSTEGFNTTNAKTGETLELPADSGPSPDELQLDPAVMRGLALRLGQVRDDETDDETDSDEEDEAENNVIEQLSHRIGTLKIAGDGHLRYYGATSNLNLVDVSATQQRQRPDARTVRQDGQEILNYLGIGQHVEQALEDHLVELYFTWQNPSAYVVDKEMYMLARSNWRDEQNDTPFYSEVLTNAMCAVGSAFEARYHPTFITFPKSLAEFFADKAKALLEIELDSPCVATVQSLIILSWHEGASNRDARGWLYSGMSMRLAFDLGLHIDMTPYVEKGDMSIFEANVRRATFWGSYIADHFWGFYLGRPFRMNAGDITVPKPADYDGGKEGVWHPYGMDTQSEVLNMGLRDPAELISRQFAILWEIVSPVSHILYGCTNISRHELQRITHKVTENLFAWKANLPPILEVDLDDATTPKLPHLLMLHMQYHQIVIFFHRPWFSKKYIQPRYPRQGPGYLHARRMCIESAIAIAKLLKLYEKHYTFRRMNNQVVAIIFTAALILLFITISNYPKSPKRGSNDGNSNADKVAYLNLCFRALDELGPAFENAKRTRDFLVSLQRRWQSQMRKSGSEKRRQTSSNAPVQRRSSQQRLLSKGPVRQPIPESDISRKKSKLETENSGNTLFTTPTTITTSLSSIPGVPLHSPGLNLQQQRQQQLPTQPGDINWISSADVNLLSDPLTNYGFPFQMMTNINENSPSYVEGSEFPSLSDLEAWWESPDTTFRTGAGDPSV